MNKPAGAELHIRQPAHFVHPATDASCASVNFCGEVLKVNVALQKGFGLGHAATPFDNRGHAQ
jgi:hypothetical protein